MDGGIGEKVAIISLTDRRLGFSECESCSLSLPLSPVHRKRASEWGVGLLTQSWKENEKRDKKRASVLLDQIQVTIILK